jgi:hypothetical protein
MFVDAILDLAFAAHQRGDKDAGSATVAALVYTTPLMKAPGFAEEQEWRLVFIPGEGAPLHLSFHPRRDFLAPFLTLDQIRTAFEAAAAHIPLVPITTIIMGPSVHAVLTQRAMEKLVAQTQNRSRIPLSTSEIPYRSLI